MHCDVAFVESVEGVQTSETEEMADDVGAGSFPLAPPPQPVIVSESKNTTRADRSRYFKHFTSDSAADCSYRRNLLFQGGFLELYALERFRDTNPLRQKHLIVRNNGSSKVHWNLSPGAKRTRHVRRL